MEDRSLEELTNDDLALFKDAVTGAGCDSTELRLFAIKRIAQLAKLLGPEKTVEELLGFIDSLLSMDSLEDQVLCGLVEELELFLPLVGGPDHCYELLSILLTINRSADEALVRTRTVEAIKKLISDIDDRITEKFLVSSLVSSTDVWFSEKCSTLSLIPVCYSKAKPESKMFLREKYCQFFEDNCGLIRKLAAMGLPEFISIMEIEHVLKEFVPVLDMIVQDDQEVVRLNAVEIAISIASKSKNKEVRNNMFEVIKAAYCGDSWKFRQRVAKKINCIAEVFSEIDFIEPVLIMYKTLCQDKEADVRKEAVLNLFKFSERLRCNLIGNRSLSFEKIFFEDIMPLITSMSEDKTVQISFSSVVLSLGLLITDEMFKETILRVVVSGLEQEYPLKFKENILMNLKYLPEDVDLSKSLTSIKDVVKSILQNSETSWRTRRSLLVSILNVAEFCTAEYFQNNLLMYYIFLLKDSIFAVRRTATLIFPVILKRYGIKWFTREVMPQILEIQKSRKYLMRYVVLFCIHEMIDPTIEKIIDQNDDKFYINDLKTLIIEDENEYGRVLCRLITLNKKLRESLNREPFKSTIKLYVDEYNISGENITMYTEEILDCIPNKYERIFSIESDTDNEDVCYLEAVLILLNRTILNIISSMLDDPVKNINLMTSYILTRIQNFSDVLDKEMSNVWISYYIRKMKASTWTEIDKELNAEIDRAMIESENDVKLDEKFMSSNLIRSSVVGNSTSQIDIPELEVFPSDRLHTDELRFEQMESLDEEKCKDSNC